jgi:hypothetical protein
MRVSSSNKTVSGTETTGFILAKDIPIDIGHTLDQLVARFRSVKDGLPELIKNSKDQYSRLGVKDRDARQIVVIADTDKHYLGVLDFAGARSNDFEGWSTWSSRTASRNNLADDIEAGHGNGGKAFMVQGAEEFAFMESCFEGRRTRMGYRNARSDERYRPGYWQENGQTINNSVENDPSKRLADYLKEFGISISALPQNAQSAFTKRQAFTGVLLAGVTEWEGRQKRKVKRLTEEVIPNIIRTQGQTALSIETCEVWVIVDGKLITAQPISPTILEPYPGFETPQIHQIPDLLTDPETGDSVDMKAGHDGPRFLQLCTTAQQLQMSDETKARNVIRLWNSRNNVANWPLQSLGVPITQVSFIYGEIRCPALVGGHLSGAERVHLNDTPLTRALEDWTRQKVGDLAEDLHRAMMAENRPRDREQAKSALRSIRNLMRQYLDPDSAGESDDEDEKQKGSSGDNGQGAKRKRKGAEYGERIDEIALEPGNASIALAHGTSVPLRYKCLEHQADGSTKPVKADNLFLVSAIPNMVRLKDGRLYGELLGRGEIWLEATDKRVSSNKISCEVVTVSDVGITVPDEPMLQGQRTKLQVTHHTAGGPRDDLLIDGMIDEPGMGLFGRSGRFTAGTKEGSATVRVRFSANPQDQRAASVPIGPDRVPPSESEGNRGSDIPEILLCGQEVPGMDEYPPEQRTHSGGEHFPTIIEDPIYQNIVWINPTSKESMRVRGGRGPTGVSKISSRTFLNFVTLKCFEVLKRLYVRQQLRGQTVTEYQFTQAAAYAEIECADFIDAAWAMSEELLTNAEAGSGQVE